MSNIKINDVFQRIQYTATNAQTQFAIPFPFFANAYVYVWQDGVQIIQGGGAGQYGITGAGSPSGGQITLVTPATAGSIITIEGIMPIDRTSIYSATISNLTGSDLNGDFNREVVMMKQIQTTQALLQLQYAPWTIISQSQNVTKDRYIPLLGVLEAWRMNAAGTAIETFTTPASGGLAPDDATYIIQVADSELPNAQAMGDLPSGLVVNTTTTGVQIIRDIDGVVNQTVITNGDGAAGNPTVGLYPNTKIPGIEGMGIPEGTTAERPVSPSGTEFRFNTDLQILEYWDGATWVQLSESDGVITAAGTANQILVNGGIAPVDGVTLFSLSPTLNFPGTFTVQGTTAINAIINDASMATATTSNLSSSAAIKSYVDALVTGLNVQGSCVCASTTALTVTYANGASGVGATLTNAGAQAAIQLDGVSPTVGQRVLIKNQASTLQNGIYTVTTVGSGATNWVLTRATDYDTPSEVAPGDLVILTGGTTQNQSSWVETATVAAIGTDPITFVQFTASLPVNVASGGTGVTSFTAYAPIVGGTTTTGSLQSITLGAAGTLFKSNGVGALPGFTTAVYPSTTTINQILYSSAANTITGLATQASSVLTTDSGGIPVISNTLPAGVQTNITQLGVITSGVTLFTGTGLRTSTSAGNTALLQAYDVDGAAYVTFGTLTANNTPTFTLNPTSVNFGSSTAGIIGTTTNNSADAGSVGEVISSVVSPGTSLTSTVSVNGTSISLTAGDWEVWGSCYFSGLTMTLLTAGISQTSATLPDVGLTGSIGGTSLQSSNVVALPQPVKLASTTTVYMVANGTFTGACSLNRANIYARRVR